MRIDVDVRCSGPMFDGRALRTLREFVDESAYEIAGRGVDVWLQIYRPQVRHPTPYYEYLVSRWRVDYGVSRVWDGGECVYGPWLEGTGSRNSSHGFPGYKSMMKTAIKLRQGIAVEAAEDLLRDRFLPRMN